MRREEVEVTTQPPPISEEDQAKFDEKLRLFRKLEKQEDMSVTTNLPLIKMFYFKDVCELNRLQPGIMNQKISDDFNEDMEMINRNQNRSLAILFTCLATGTYLATRGRRSGRPLMTTLGVSVAGTFIGNLMFSSQNTEYLLKKYPIEEILSGPLTLQVKDEREKFYRANGIKKAEKPPPRKPSST